MQTIVENIWRKKYALPTENSIEDTLRRMADAIYAKDTLEEKNKALLFLLDRSILPAGRIYAGAGTGRRVTLINCFVSPRIQDSMNTLPELEGKGIMDALKDAALTQQMGGGIGMGFSSVRPRDAIVKQTASVSSGVLPFMDMWHSMCGTIMSSGSRRGAMMGTIAIWHPDVVDFVRAKREKGRLTNFNVSVLVTDAFMECLEKDLDWDLYFTVPRADNQHVDVYDRNGETHYVYSRIKARWLWDQIIENTYIYAEPGVIFIDRINQQNNLAYCETIDATNPCGEQPLPPNGDCNLGHLNLAVMVLNPFTKEAKFDWKRLDESARVLVRLLDNVLDVSLFPTVEQEKEAANKRRTGIGFTGLANALQQLLIRYGTFPAVEFTRKITRCIRDAVYDTSMDLAQERGVFPAYVADKYCDSPFIKGLPSELQEKLKSSGIRNGVLMSLAPVGTVSLIAGNVSSGLEPVFLHSFSRKVLNPDGKTFKIYDVFDYGYLLYKKLFGESDLPDCFVTAKDLTVDEHLSMQAAAQEFIDASISKTVNCPESMTFDEFKNVYNKAYNLGLKGCTTYRPDPRSIRGEVLSDKKTVVQDKIPMLDVVEGRRYRIKWPGIANAFYVVITDYVDKQEVRRPFELFLTSKSAQHQEWATALTLLITAIFRRGGDVSFIVEELKQVCSAQGGCFYNRRYTNSLVAAIGQKIEEHLQWLGLLPKTNDKEILGANVCIKCGAKALVLQEGCKKCLSCGFSDCG